MFYFQIFLMKSSLFLPNVKLVPELASHLRLISRMHLRKLIYENHLAVFVF